MRSRAKIGVVLGAAVALAATASGGASAHVQVTPSVVAPSDPVEFTVLVPGERDTGTVKVDLRLPPDLIPFSFEDPPGWKRRVVRGDDGSAERIVWTGRAAPDGLVRFVFLAGTPEQPTTMPWKSLQTYADGHVSRWIGAADAEYPAAFTEVRADAPRRNAGGEGASSADASASGGDAAPAAATADGSTADSAPASASVSASADPDWVARGIGIAALVVGLAVGGTLLARRREGSRS